MVNLRKSVKFQKKIRLRNTHITSRIAIKLAEKNWGGMNFKKMRILKIVGVINELASKQNSQSSQKLI